jgi:hypothetical protein
MAISFTTAYAQEKFVEFQGGVLIPNDAKTGFIGGVSFGRMIDQSVGWGIELNYYRKSYSKESTYQLPGEGQVEPVIVTTEFENATTMLPVYLKLMLNTQIAPGLDLRLAGGAGYEFMWNSVTDHKQDIDESHFYTGFTWLAGAGLSMPISMSTDIYLEANYHSGSPSRDATTPVEGLPARTEVDMSGFIIRLGIRLYSIGF